MDQYTPSNPNQQSENPQPYQPPQAPQYQQPPASQGYQAPPQQQHGYPQQPPQQQYQQPGGGQYYQAPPPPPAKPKKGFNWLMCCGITCGCLVIIAIIGGIGVWMVGKNFAEWGQSFDAAAEEVNNTPAEQIRAGATIVDSRVLGDNPESYADQWVAIEGVIAGDVSAGTSFNMGQYGTQNSTTYVLEGGVIVLDLSQSPQVGYSGDMIRAYGKAMVFDMSNMPLFGGFMEKAMEEAAKSDPNMQDIPVKMVMFYTKDVELLTNRDAGGSGGGSNGDVAPPWEQPKW